MLTRSCSSEISRCTDEVNPWKFGAEREVTPRKQFADRCECGCSTGTGHCTEKVWSSEIGRCG